MIIIGKDINLLKEKNHTVIFIIIMVNTFNVHSFLEIFIN